MGGVWVGLGHVFSHALTVTANFLGIRLVVLFVGAFALYLPFQRTRPAPADSDGPWDPTRRSHDLRHSLAQTSRPRPLTTT